MGKKIQKKEKIREAFMFLIKLNLLLIPFYAVIYFDVDFYPLQTLFAKSIVFFLNLFGLESFNFGYFIYLGVSRFPIDISRDCIGWKSAYSLFAMVLASPGLWKSKKMFLMRWIPVLLVINFFRVLLTILIGFGFGFNLLEPLHSVWQHFTVLMIVGIWYLWIRKIYHTK